jgi:adenylate cyclase
MGPYLQQAPELPAIVPARTPAPKKAKEPLTMELLERRFGEPRERAEAHQAMGLVALRRRQWDLAGEHYERAIGLNPNDVHIAGDQAQWLLFVGRLDEALRCLNSAVQRDPYPPTWIWEVRGHILYHLKRYDEAIVALRSVRAEPFWMPKFLAAAYAQAGQLENARREAAKFLEAGPGASLSAFNPYAVQDLWDHLREGLRKAGLPG